MQEVNGSQGVQGRYLPAFQAVVDVFAANLSGGLESGAACAIYRGGELVVDIWGGERDSAGAPWQDDTVVPLYSVTKGIAALCILHLVERGRLSLDEPVSSYWPEFAANGKQRVTVREALSHRAGIPFVEGPVTLDDLAQPQRMAARLAAQAPIFEPGSNHSYHGLTVGWITSELVRRVSGKSMGEWIADHLAPRLCIDLWLGLPEAQRRRVAFLDVQSPELRTMWPSLLPPGSLGWKMGTLNGLLELLPGMGGLDFNDARVQAVELAAGNLISNARSLAKCYAACLGEVDGFRFVSAATIADACKPMSSGVPFDSELPGASWGAGLMIPWPCQPMLGPASFGHDGFGGSLAFADPESGISFAYVRSRLAGGGGKDALVYGVVDALREQLKFPTEQ